jgi:hypothetical protein
MILTTLDGKLFQMFPPNRSERRRHVEHPAEGLELNRTVSAGFA